MDQLMSEDQINNNSESIMQADNNAQRIEFFSWLTTTSKE